MVQRVGDDDDEDGFFKCSRCGGEILNRRREMHETQWCPALPQNEGLCPHGLRYDDCGECHISDSPDADRAEDAKLFETPAVIQKQQRLTLMLLFIFVAPACVAVAMTFQEWLKPLVLEVGYKDSSTVQRIFFGGEKWVVYCVNGKTAGGKHLAPLRKAAEKLLAEDIRVAEVNCWSPLPTRKGPRTLASRFHFRDKPPVTLYVADKEKPQLMNSLNLDTGALVKQAIQMSRSSSSGRAMPKEKEVYSKRGGRIDRVGKRPREDNSAAESVDDTSGAAADETAPEAEDNVEL